LAVGRVSAVARSGHLAFAAVVLLIVLAAVLASFDPYKESIVGRQRGDPFRKERDRRFESGSLQ